MESQRVERLESMIIEAVQEVASDDSELNALIELHMKEFPFHLRVYRGMFTLGLEHLKSIGNFDLDEMDDSWDLVRADKIFESSRMKLITKEEMITTVASYVVRYKGKALYRELMKDAWTESKAVYFRACTLDPAPRVILKKTVEEPGYFEDVVYKLAVRNRDNFIDHMIHDAKKFYLSFEDMMQIRADLHLSLII